MDLGALVLRIIADDKPVKRSLDTLPAQADKAGQKAGQALGQGVSKGTSAGLKGTNDAIARLQGRLSAATRAVSRQLADARTAEAAAARKVSIAEEKLKEVRANSSARASQLAGAEDRLARSQSVLAAAQDRTAASAGRLTRVQQDMGKNVSIGDKLKAPFEGLPTVIAGGAVALGAFGTLAAVTGVKTAASMETARIGFTTMLGSAEKADAFLKQLSQFAATTPFEFPELQTAASSLIAAGISADKVIPIMTTLGDVTQGVGTGSEGIKRATIALQQMTAAGKIQAQDLNQLRDAGIPVYDLLAAATGKSAAEVVALANAGKLGKTELDAMMNALETGKGLERFNGLMAKTSGTLQGLASTLQDTFSQGMAQAIEPSIPMLKQGLLGAINAISDAMPSLQQGFGSVAHILGQLAPVAKALGDVALHVVLPGLSAIADILGGTLFASSQSATVAVGALLAVMAVRKLGQFAPAVEAIGTKLFSMGGRAEMAGLKVVGLSGTMSKISSFMGGPWGIAIGVGVTALIGLATAHAQARKEMKSFTDALTFENGALDENSQKTLAKQLADEGTLAAAIKAGISEKDYTAALIAGGTARQSMIADLDTLRAAHTHTQSTMHGSIDVSDELGLAAEKAANGLRDMGSSLDGSAVASKQAASATSDLSTKVDAVSQHYRDLKGATDDVATAEHGVVTETQKMIDKFTILNQGALGVERANEAWQQSLDDVTAAAKANGHSLNDGTDKGRANRQAIIGMITALNDKVTADAKAAGSTKGVNKEVTAGEAAIRAAAHAAGYNKDQVDAMIKKMLLTPKEQATQFKSPGLKDQNDKLKTNIDRMNLINGFVASATVKTKIKFDPDKLAASMIKGDYFNNPNAFQHRADGGAIQNVSGRGSKGKDTEPVLAAVGEHMWTAKEVDAAGGHTAVRGIRAAALRGDLKGYAGGGEIIIRGQATTSQNLSRIESAAAAAAGGAGQAYADHIGALWATAATKKAKQAIGSGGGPVAGGSFATALEFARAHAGHPYVFGTQWDCSGLISKLQSIITGQAIRWSTPAFAGGPAHAMGWTRNKISPFMMGVDPRPGKFGHTAGTLNGYNVEEAGSVGLRVGPTARGWHSPMFPLHYGLWTGTDNAPRGFNWSAEKGAELVLNPQLRGFSGGEKVLNASDTKQALGGHAPLIGGDLIVQSHGNTRDDMDEVMFRLRSLKRGGAHG